MSLRQRAIITVALVSLVSATIFSGSMLYLTRSTLGTWENRKLERGIEIAVAAARDPAERADALQSFRTYRQLQAVRALIEQRVIFAGLGFGLLVFLLSLAVSSLVLTRITKPLNDLTRAINQAGGGDLTVKVEARPGSEVGAVASAFNQMTERLRRIQEDLKRAERLAAWRDVARILGHEVRNPLTPIRLSVERLEQKNRDRSPDLGEVVEKSCRTILQEITALDRIVTEFSDFARLPSPRGRPAQLNRLLADVIAQYSASAPNVEFRSDLDPELGESCFDPDLLRRAFANLIKNSIEAFDGKPGRVEVSTRAKGRFTIVTIADNGPGIPAEVRTRIFEPYYTTKTKGTGLGLAVVRQIVTEHQGTIELETGPGSGTKFTIVLPKGESNESQAAGR